MLRSNLHISDLTECFKTKETKTRGAQSEQAYENGTVKNGSYATLEHIKFKMKTNKHLSTKRNSSAVVPFGYSFSNISQ